MVQVGQRIVFLHEKKGGGSVCWWVFFCTPGEGPGVSDSGIFQQEGTATGCLEGIEPIPIASCFELRQTGACRSVRRATGFRSHPRPPAPHSCGDTPPPETDPDTGPPHSHTTGQLIPAACVCACFFLCLRAGVGCRDAAPWGATRTLTEIFDTLCVPATIDYLSLGRAPSHAPIPLFSRSFGVSWHRRTKRYF